MPTIPQSPSPVLHTDMHIRLCQKIKINLTKFYDQCDKPFPTDPPLLNLFVCFSLVSHHDRGLKERKRTRFVYFICFLLLFPLSSGIRNKRIYGNILKREVAEHQCGIVASASGWSHWTNIIGLFIASLYFNRFTSRAKKNYIPFCLQREIRIYCTN